MVHILPGRPVGKPDQMSPIRAAVPVCESSLVQAHGAHAYRKDPASTAVGSTARPRSGASSQNESSRICAVVHGTAHRIPGIGIVLPLIEEQGPRWKVPQRSIGHHVLAMLRDLHVPDMLSAAGRGRSLPDTLRSIECDSGGFLHQVI